MAHTCPGGPQEIEDEHHDEGRVAKLAVGATGEQVTDGVLACRASGDVGKCA